MAAMDNSEQILPLRRTADEMLLDSDLWVVPRYEELHLINILALQRRLSAFEHQANTLYECEVRQNNGQECPPSCSHHQSNFFPELQQTLKAYGNSLYCSDRVLLTHLGEAVLALAAIKKTEDPAPHVFDGLKRKGGNVWESTLNDILRWPRNPVLSHPGDESSHLLSISKGPRSWFQRCVERHDHLGRMFKKVSFSKSLSSGPNQ